MKECENDNEKNEWWRIMMKWKYNNEKIMIVMNNDNEIMKKMKEVIMK